MSDLGLGANSDDELKTAAENMVQAVKGRSDNGGLPAFHVTKDALDQLQGNYREAMGELLGDDMEKINMYAHARLLLAGSAHRDAQYATRGRKFMRCMGANTFIMAAYGRSEVFINAKAAED